MVVFVLLITLFFLIFQCPTLVGYTSQDCQGENSSVSCCSQTINTTVTVTMLINTANLTSKYAIDICEKGGTSENEDDVVTTQALDIYRLKGTAPRIFFELSFRCKIRWKDQKMEIVRVLLLSSCRMQRHSQLAETAKAKAGKSLVFLLLLHYSLFIILTIVALSYFFCKKKKICPRAGDKV